MKLGTTKVSDMKALISRKIGLPVSCFRLVTSTGVEMYNHYCMPEYEINIGNTIRVENWDGVNDYLQNCIKGVYEEAFEELKSENDAVSQYFLRLAQYIAAHYGHKNLAIETMKKGIKPSEPVGEHPLRIWNKIDKHSDSFKCPIHEAAEFGQLAIVKEFISSDLAAIFTLDEKGRKPVWLAMKNKHRPCAAALISAEFSKIPYENTKISVTIVQQLRKWGQKAREKVAQVFGYEKSSSRQKMINGSINPHVGDELSLKGFQDTQMNSKSKDEKLKDEARKLSNKMKNRNEKTRKQMEIIKGYCKNLISVYDPNKLNEVHKKFPKPPFVRLGVDKEYLLTPIERSHQKTGSRSFRDKEIPPILEADERSETMELKDAGNITENQLSYIRKQSKTDMDSFSRDSSFRTESDQGTQSETGGILTNMVKFREKKAVQKSENSEKANSKAEKDSAVKRTLPGKTIGENYRRPFCFVNERQRDVAKETLERFERFTGLNRSEIPVHCLSIANKFSRKPFLSRVNLALRLTKKHVHKQCLKLQLSNQQL